jgi:hypothetical protein
MPYTRTAKVNLDSLTQGDDIELELRFKTEDGPVDISGWSLTLTIRRDHRDDTEIFSTVLSLVEPVEGICEALIPQADSEQLFGLYHYDVAAQIPDGNGGTVHRTVIVGTLQFTEQVTKNG